MRVLICGDRNWSDVELIHSNLPSETVAVIHGGCRGADRIGGAVAESLGISVEVFPARWERYGRGAGPIRNEQMLDQGKPDLVIAFHPDLTKSRGTRNLVGLARKRGIRTIIIPKGTAEGGR